MSNTFIDLVWCDKFRELQDKYKHEDPQYYYQLIVEEFNEYCNQEEIKLNERFSVSGE